MLDAKQRHKAMTPFASIAPCIHHVLSGGCGQHMQPVKHNFGRNHNKWAVPRDPPHQACAHTWMDYPAVHCSSHRSCSLVGPLPPCSFPPLKSAHGMQVSIEGYWGNAPFPSIPIYACSTTLRIPLSGIQGHAYRQEALQ